MRVFNASPTAVILVALLTVSWSGCGKSGLTLANDSGQMDPGIRLRAGANLGKSAPSVPVDAPDLGSVETPDQASRPEFTELLTLINRHRATNGVAPLVLNGALGRAAQWQSEDMAARGILSHTDSRGRDSFQRMADFKYAPGISGPSAEMGYTTLAENIACGHRDAGATFEQWKNSPPHNTTLLGSRYRDLGLGRAVSDSGGEHGCRWYWTADFGGVVSR